MADIITWPICLLPPQKIQASVVPFTRSGGTTLGGITPSTRTDLGYWSIEYGNVVVRNRTRAQWQTWNALRQSLGGRSGLIAVPVRSSLFAPYATGSFEPVIDTEFSDGTIFDDGSSFDQNAISVVAEGVTDAGSTSIRMRVVNAAPNMVGVRFSYKHALYETGPASSVDGDIWEVPIWPAVRELIPSAADLEFDRPTCLCHLAEDNGMDISQDAIAKNVMPTVRFTEAVDYWANL